MSDYTGETKTYLSVGAAAGLLGHAIAIGGGILAQIIIARSIDITDFGIYSLVTTLTFLGAIVLRCGLHSLAVRRLAQLSSGDDLSEVHAEARRIATISIVIAGAALPLLGLVGLPLVNRIFLDGRLGPGTQWVVAVTICFEAVRFVFSEAFRGLHRQVAATLLGNAGRTVLIVVAVVTAVAIAQGLDLTTTLILVLAASALTAMIGGLALWVRTAQPAGFRPTLPTRHTLQTIRGGAPFLLTELSSFALVMGDVLVVGLIGTHDDVAIYAAASRAAAMLAVPAYVLVGLLNPVISTAWARGETDRLQRTLRLCLTAALVPTVCGLTVIVLFGGEVLALLFGEPYSRGAILIVVLAVGAAGNVVFGMGFQVLMLCGRARVATAVTIAFSAGTFLGEFVLAQVWGVPGVAIASASGVLLQQLTLAVICARLTAVRAYPGGLRRPARLDAASRRPAEQLTAHSERFTRSDPDRPEAS